MRLNRFITAATTSLAMVAAPAVAAPTPAASSIASVARADAATDSADELFRGRKGRGGALVFILIAVVIAVGIYIVVDDDKESPASP